MPMPDVAFVELFSLRSNDFGSSIRWSIPRDIRPLVTLLRSGQIGLDVSKVNLVVNNCDSSGYSTNSVGIFRVFRTVYMELDSIGDR